MTNKEAIEVLSVIRRTPSVDIFNTLPNTADSCIEFDYRSAFDLAIKALEFAESQRLCCENCVNHNRKSKEVCTSPYGQCEFFEDKV